MHLSAVLHEESFEASADGRPVAPASLLPGWSAHDRFGVVVHQPFGALGAGLLIQLAISRFYAVRPRRRDQAPQYPEIYLFHVAARHGDHSSLDFWPPRKEIDVSADPAEILAAVNDRAITRLAVPHGLPQPTGYVEAGPSGWSERSSFTERIVSAYAYAPCGDVPGADIELRATGPSTAAGPADVLAPDAVFTTFAAMSDAELLAQEIGPSSAGDLRAWLQLLEPRIGEVPAPLRSRLAGQWTASVRDGCRRESYRRLSIEQTLGLLSP